MRRSLYLLRRVLRGRVTVDRLGAFVDRRPSAETISQHRWEGERRDSERGWEGNCRVAHTVSRDDTRSTRCGVSLGVRTLYLDLTLFLFKRGSTATLPPDVSPPPMAAPGASRNDGLRLPGPRR